jgi:hypothetical protein
MKNCCIVCVVDLGLRGKNVQTKRKRHCPQCGGDVYGSSILEKGKGNENRSEVIGIQA